MIAKGEISMSKASFAEMNCPIALTLERVGARRILLILRNAFCGMRRFDQFQRHLGIGTNILANRLRSLTGEGIMTRSQVENDGRAFEYRLTGKGMALFPILIAMIEWGTCCRRATWPRAPDRRPTTRPTL